MSQSLGFIPIIIIQLLDKWYWKSLRQFNLTNLLFYTINSPFSESHRRGLPEVVLCSFDASQPPIYSDSSDLPSSSSSSVCVAGINKHKGFGSQSNIFGDGDFRGSQTSILQSDRGGKLDHRTKAIKIDPVDVSKLGQPRSRKPIIKGDLKRVSDVTFAAETEVKIIPNPSDLTDANIIIS